MTALVLQPDEQDLRKHVLAINQYAQGRSNAGGTFTCLVGSATTTVLDANVGSGSFISICPASASGAAEIAAGTLYIPKATIKAGSFVVQHANSSTAGRTFQYHVQG
jgi:hypothetical protein